MTPKRNGDGTSRCVVLPGACGSASAPASAQSGAHARSNSFRKLDPVVLGIAPAPIDDDTWADCCMMFWQLPTQRKIEFFQLKTRVEKRAFLLRYGHFEQRRTCGAYGSNPTGRC